MRVRVNILSSLHLASIHPQHPGRRWKIKQYLAVAWFSFLLPFGFARPGRAEKVGELKPQGYVNDFAGVIDSPTTAQLTAICTEVDQKTHAQISVVTIKTLEGLEAADFANQLYKKWGVGYKDENRGALILLATGDHKYWTEVGYGLEPILPDGKVGGFGREMVPSLRAGGYSGGLLHITAQIAQVIAADRGVKLDSLSNIAQTIPPQSYGNRGHTGINFSPLAYLILICVLLVIIRFLSPLGGLRHGGGWMRGGYRVGGSWGGFGGGGFSSGGGGGGFGGFGGGASGGGGAGGGW